MLGDGQQKMLSSISLYLYKRKDVWQIIQLVHSNFELSQIKK